MNMPDESPVESWTRLDLLASICKFTLSEPSQLVHVAVMASILIWPMILLIRRGAQEFDDGLAGGTGALILLALLSSLYHQSYDALLVTAPLVGAAASRIAFWQTMSVRTKLVLTALMLFPAFNYLSTQSILSRLQLGDFGERVVTSLNGFALAAALVVVCVQLGRRAGRS